MGNVRDEYGHLPIVKSDKTRRQMEDVIQQLLDKSLMTNACRDVVLRTYTT